MSKVTFSSLQGGQPQTMSSTNYFNFKAFDKEGNREQMVTDDDTVLTREGSDSRKTRRIESGGEAKEADSTLWNENFGEDSSAKTLKRPRLVWTVQLHKRFLDVDGHLEKDNDVFTLYVSTFINLSTIIDYVNAVTQIQQTQPELGDSNAWYEAASGLKKGGYIFRFGSNTPHYFPEAVRQKNSKSGQSSSHVACDEKIDQLMDKLAWLEVEFAALRGANQQCSQSTD
nr:transcription factor PCL1-like [Ipomoea batatas]